MDRRSKRKVPTRNLANQIAASTKIHATCIGRDRAWESLAAWAGIGADLGREVRGVCLAGNEWAGLGQRQ